MSERFLEGFIVDPKALDALIGTPKLAAKAIRKKLGKSQSLRDVEMTLARSYEADEADEAGKMVDAALDTLAKRRPNAKDDETAMVRIALLVLTAYFERLGTIELLPFVVGDRFGLMNPVFKALHMPTMAKEYGAESFAFPYKKSNQSGWPILTLVHKSLAAWKAELATDWAKRLPTLDNKPFVNKKYVVSADEIAMTKEELVPAINALKKWVDKAAKKTGHALVLILDGDQ